MITIDTIDERLMQIEHPETSTAGRGERSTGLGALRRWFRNGQPEMSIQNEIEAGSSNPTHPAHGRSQINRMRIAEVSSWVASTIGSIR